MLRRCCVVGCNAKSSDGVEMHSFPKWKRKNGDQMSEITKKRRMAWVSAVRRNNITFNKIPKHMYVCPRHFHTGKPACEMKDTDPDWAPSLHLGHTDLKASLHNTEWYLRNERRQARTAAEPEATMGPEPEAPVEPYVIVELEPEAPMKPHVIVELEPDSPVEPNVIVELEPEATVKQEPEAPKPEPEIPVEPCVIVEQKPEAPIKPEPEATCCDMCHHKDDQINRLLVDIRHLKELLSQKQFDEEYFEGKDEQVIPLDATTVDETAQVAAAPMLLDEDGEETAVVEQAAVLADAPLTVSIIKELEDHLYCCTTVQNQDQSVESRLQVKMSSAAPAMTASHQEVIRFLLNRNDVSSVSVRDMPQKRSRGCPRKHPVCLPSPALQSELVQPEKEHIIQIKTKHSVSPSASAEENKSLLQGAKQQQHQGVSTITPISICQPSLLQMEAMGPLQKVDSNIDTELICKLIESMGNVTKVNQVVVLGQVPPASIQNQALLGQGEPVNVSAGPPQDTLGTTTDAPQAVQERHTQTNTTPGTKHTNDVLPAKLCDQGCGHCGKNHWKLPVKKQTVNKCDKCGKTYFSNWRLQEHLRTHDKPYQCDECGRMFATSNELRNHHMIHTGEKPYPCDQCGKYFRQKCQLKTHVKIIHSGERPYQCDQCGKSFSTLGNLKTHLRIHTGEKPYLCNLCGERFSSGSSLKSHQRTHNGQKHYHCRECVKGFSTRSELKTHKMIHTGGKTLLLPPMRGKVRPTRSSQKAQ